MNRHALIELYDYTTFTWAAYGHAASTLEASEFKRPLTPGWPSLRDVLFHLAGGWDWWLRDQLELGDPLDLTPNELSSWDDLQPHRLKVRAWMRRVIDESTDADLARPTARVWEDSPASMMVSKAEVLSHILLHERGHHGDVSNALSQLGAAVPEVDYLVYLFFKRRKPRG
jgi:uncharacterized damage-inducible protein DinB